MSAPKLHLDVSASPGDVLRAIADWYDRTGEPMPSSIMLYRHEHEVPADQGGYAHVLSERYGLPVHPHDDGSGPYRRAELALHEQQPAVTLMGFSHYQRPALWRSAD